MKLNLASRLAAVLAVLLTATALTTGPAGASAVDAYAGYQPQQSCTSKHKPGTEYLLRWLMRKYPHTGSSGTLRACNSGGTSEHKDGRALDWGVDVAVPAQVADADRFLARAFATDKRGNNDALARRMGIMYIIWNDHIYSAYSNGFQKRPYLAGSCESRRKCSKTNRHRDHMHISLSYSGAAAQSTFYRNRGVTSIPVLKPGTRQLDPVSTAVVKVTVPSDGTVVGAGFKLTRGTTYRIVGDGLYRAGPGTKVADAACRWSPRGWTAHDNGLLVNGHNPWATTCDDGHTHVAEITPRRTRALRLQIGDSYTRNNQGSLTFYILREDLAARSVATTFPHGRRHPHEARNPGPVAKRLHKETVDVRARARGGVLTNHSLRRNGRYRVVVTGVAKSGADRFDGNCVRYAGRLRPQHSLALSRPAADHLSLWIQGVKVELRVPGSKASCDGKKHRYVGSFKAVQRGKARVRVWDPFRYADNTGSLSVRMVKKS